MAVGGFVTGSGPNWWHVAHHKESSDVARHVEIVWRWRCAQRIPRPPSWQKASALALVLRLWGMKPRLDVCAWMCHAGVQELTGLQDGLTAVHTYDTAGQRVRFAGGPSLPAPFSYVLAPPLPCRVQILGIPVWIAAVYFAGGPAVGLLGRRVRATLAQQESARQ
eukprot:350539-Chlamydomonas_euryale.AAC.3